MVSITRLTGLLQSDLAQRCFGLTQRATELYVKNTVATRAFMCPILATINCALLAALLNPTTCGTDHGQVMSL